MSAEYKLSKDLFELTVWMKEDDNTIEFSVEVLQQDDDTRVIYVSRTHGCIFFFNEIFVQLKDYFGNKVNQ